VDTFSSAFDQILITNESLQTVYCTTV